MLHKTILTIFCVIIACYGISIAESDTWKKDLLIYVVDVVIFFRVILIWCDSYRNYRDRKKEDETEKQAQQKQDNNN